MDCVCQTQYFAHTNTTAICPQMDMLDSTLCTIDVTRQMLLMHGDSRVGFGSRACDVVPIFRISCLTSGAFRLQFTNVNTEIPSSEYK